MINNITFVTNIIFFFTYPVEHCFRWVNVVENFPIKRNKTRFLSTMWNFTPYQFPIKIIIGKSIFPKMLTLILALCTLIQKVMDSLCRFKDICPLSQYWLRLLKKIVISILLKLTVTENHLSICKNNKQVNM